MSRSKQTKNVINRFINIRFLVICIISNVYTYTII